MADTELRLVEKAVMDAVLSREGKRRYNKGDSLTLDPSDLRDIVRLTMAKCAAPPSPSEEEMRARRHAEAVDKLLASAPSTAPEMVDPTKRTGRQLMDQWNAGARELAERDAFEAWARDPIRAEKLPLDRWPTNDGYKDTRTYIAFYGWKSGRAALASRPAEVDDEGLPALPQAKAWRFRSYDGREECHSDIWQFTDIRRVMEIHQHHKAIIEPLFTAEQFRRGQRDAVAADRARRGVKS